MCKKIKILNLSSHLGIGGSEIQLRLVSLSLSQKKYEMAILIYNNSDHFVFNDELRKKGIKIYQSNFNNSLLKLIHTLYVIITFKPKIIHSWNSYINPIAYFLGKLFFVKKIIGSVRGSPKNEFIRYKSWRKKLYLLGNNIVVNSNEIIKELKEIGLKTNNAIYIPNLIEESKKSDNKTKENYIKEYKISKNDFVFVNVGNYRKEKNQKFLIEIINYLSHSISNIKCLIVGQTIAGQENVYYELCNLIDKYGLQEKVILTGFIKDTASIIDLADIYIHTSISEGTSNALLEAMQLGKCIVTTEIGGAKDLIIQNENGIILPCNNLNENLDVINFSNKLIELFHNKTLRESLGKNANIFIKENFKHSNIICLYDKIYN
ncbi:MAG: glycosyltransferase [Bacteroidetes bacterium]|nr:glycosyltransferase [Bacteroidota bacterium]